MAIADGEQDVFFTDVKPVRNQFVSMGSKRNQVAGRRTSAYRISTYRILAAVEGSLNANSGGGIVAAINKPKLVLKDPS